MWILNFCYKIIVLYYRNVEISSFMFPENLFSDSKIIVLHELTKRSLRACQLDKGAAPSYNPLHWPAANIWNLSDPLL